MGGWGWGVGGHMCVCVFFPMRQNKGRGGGEVCLRVFSVYHLRQSKERVSYSDLALRSQTDLLNRFFGRRGHIFGCVLSLP